MLDLDQEKRIFTSGAALLGALDEAGRGPLAGPVVAACVLVQPDFKISGPLADIKDSKKLSEKKREELFGIIMQEFPGVGVGWCDHATIDRINILEATFLAMKKALGALKVRPNHLLVDGHLKIPNISQNQTTVINGDASVFSIAAASIIAKVTRDRMMKEFAQKYPQYEFAKHKGYGTKLHFERLRQHGPSPIHRLSFAPLPEWFAK